MSRTLGDDEVERLRSVLALPEIGNERYHPIRPLGRGGMGTVYLAKDELLEREVALKVINLEQSDRASVARMQREAKIIARLEHPSIVPVHDVGSLPDGRIYYVMKLIRGRRLDEAVGGLPIPERLRIFLRICDAISFAHANGVIHRDLKPANIMVGPFGEVQVMDWGIAKILGSAENDSAKFVSHNGVDTGAGLMLGTPGFMAPEQARGDRDAVGQRSDIYSLGVILEEIARTGAGSRRSRAIERPLRAIRDKAVAAAPDDRYSTVEALETDVRHLLDDLPVSAYRAPMLERLGHWAYRSRAAIGVILAYVVMRLILFALFGR